MRTLLFVNGDIHDDAAVRRFVQPGDYLVAADGGASHCRRLGLTPHVVVGDLDSLDAAEVDALAAAGVDIERHPPGKDKTDLELAVERALRDGATEIVLLGALGGRLDQSLANVLLLAQRVWMIPLRVVEGNQTAQVLRGGESLTLTAAVGSTVSLLPLSAAVTGITYRGLRYPLEDATLELGSTRGVSNEVAESPATIAIRTGIALVVQIGR